MMLRLFGFLVPGAVVVALLNSSSTAFAPRATFAAEPPETVSETLFVATAVTPAGDFTGGIEGPACDAAGNLYAVNYQAEHTLGRVSPTGQGEVFVTLPGGSTGNGIVFRPTGEMLVADYSNHNVLSIDLHTRKVSVFAHDDGMDQPNDLAIAPGGDLYLSDPNWKAKSGQIWWVSATGECRRLQSGLGTTNGIEVSPNGKRLYVNETVQRKIWSYEIVAPGTLGEKLLLKSYDDHYFDGMRCDVDGNLYVTRYGKGTVVVLSPEGETLHEIDVLGANPSNICFGGPDGRTAYVTEVEHKRVVAFRTKRPGLAWARWQEAALTVR